ncbi:hypothetical protein EDM57_19510 [Brevibacillus gelatini]|uniref:Uncharacterized protein n=1 Tax=Brevibacillus gelatini TaxID=1655277 RepID=A0A3M8ASG1_9BACL|nr:hypothetical protein [Brevibacillus gelatini]RNB53485.1 hypothetical protein EDM57_19510 [Brevibacillus gelatini]
MNKLLLAEQLSQLTDWTMRICIKDLAEDALPESAPVIEKPLAKWEFTEEGEHVRLYFNHCQFVAVPIWENEVGFTNHQGEIVLTAHDRRGKLLYRIAFVS